MVRGRGELQREGANILLKELLVRYGFWMCVFVLQEKIR